RAKWAKRQAARPQFATEIVRARSESPRPARARRAAACQALLDLYFLLTQSMTPSRFQMRLSPTPNRRAADLNARTSARNCEMLASLSNLEMNGVRTATWRLSIARARCTSGRICAGGCSSESLRVYDT